ncbi:MULTISPECIES: hypothetical protein [unclassified Streptomyces]|uniref:hypothetical protein n=1 Tax=unclassified Streptomyces TaxID=2593676 RepID=UPI00236513FD|nr:MULTISPECIES: hypothetical protein [unclassified Streptomyces]MDF3141081.1 hypothetical protein [Streptomyces sp. T21Q-yed]WDF45066.1 hypothetical protein PBV52_51110 [Streptomyces sp. T12]
MRSATGLGPAPFITAREGEDAAPADDLVILNPERWPTIHYWDEDPRDRPLQRAGLSVLWARCWLNPLDDRGMPMGAPVWKDMHPYRQMGTMLGLRCQVCAGPAKTPLGYVFLAGPKDQDPAQPTFDTNQPPVCPKHARSAAALCPHMEKNPMVFLVQAGDAPLYGVHGTVYGLNASSEVVVVATPDHALPFGHPNIATTVASQLIRRLTSFRVLGIDELTQELTALAT